MASRFVPYLYAALSLFPFLSAAGGPVPGDSKISSRIVAATVYNDRAMVTREGKATVLPGIQKVTLTPLPVGLQDESVRVSATGLGDTKILEVKVHRRFLDTVSTARITPLLQKSRMLAKLLRELKDRSAVIVQQKEFLSKIGFASQESISRELKTQRPSIDDYRKLLGFFDSEFTRLDKDARALDDQTTETQQAFQTVQREIREIGGRPDRSEKEITITFEVTRGGTLDIRSTYIISQAGWTPGYDVRVGSTDSIVSLTYAAYVRQNTGEDWNDAKITLSTSHPSSGGAPPELLPWYIGPADRAVGTIAGYVHDAETGEPLVGASVVSRSRPGSVTSDINGFFSFTSVIPGSQEIVASAYGYTSASAMAMVRPFSTTRIDLSLTRPPEAETDVSLGAAGLTTSEVTTMRERPIVSKNATNAVRIDESGRPVSAPPTPAPAPPPVLFQTAAVSNAATAASFDIPGETTIPSDNSGHRVTIMVAPLVATFSHTAAPKLQNDVFFRASLRNTTEYPLLAGPLSVYVDNSFVSTSKLRAVMPGEQFDAFLGVDNGVRVERRLLNKVSEVSGLFSKTRKTHYEILITAENRKKVSQMLSLRENIPVSQDERVKVDIVLPRPEDLTPDANGMLTWQIRLAPGEKREIKVQYSIEAPADLTVGGLE